MQIARVAVAVVLMMLVVLAASTPVPAQEKKNTDVKEKADAVPALMDDDQLPTGALARVGTVRFRHGSVVTSLAYSKDGKTIVTASWDTTVRMWDAASGRELRAFSVSQAPVLAAVLSPDGKTLASAGRDMQIHRCDVVTGKPLQTWAGHQNWVEALAFSPDGKRLASGARWERATGGGGDRQAVGHDGGPRPASRGRGLFRRRQDARLGRRRRIGHSLGRLGW